MELSSSMCSTRGRVLEFFMEKKTIYTITDSWCFRRGPVQMYAGKEPLLRPGRGPSSPEPRTVRANVLSKGVALATNLASIISA